MSDQINDCSFYFYFICANWNIVVKIVDIVIMAQDLIALCNFFIQLIYRDNMYIIPIKYIQITNNQTFDKEFTKVWKACNRQKRFGSSNLPHSALFLKHANAHPRASVFFYSKGYGTGIYTCLYREW